MVPGGLQDPSRGVSQNIELRKTIHTGLVYRTSRPRFTEPIQACLHPAICAGFWEQLKGADSCPRLDHCIEQHLYSRHFFPVCSVWVQGSFAPTARWLRRFPAMGAGSSCKCDGNTESPGTPVEVVTIKDEEKHRENERSSPRGEVPSPESRRTSDLNRNPTTP